MAQSKTAPFRWGVLLIGIFVGIVLGLVLALTAAWKLGGNAVIEVLAPSKPAVLQPPVAANPPSRNGEKASFDFYKILPEGSDAPASPPAAGKPPAAGTAVTAIQDKDAAGRTQTTTVTASAATPVPPVATSTKPKETYWLQVGSFARQEEAENRKAELALYGWEAAIQKSDVPGRGMVYRVRVGPYDNAEQTGRMKAELSQRKFEVAVVRQ